MSARIAVYGQDVFGRNVSSVNQRQIAALQQSGFDTLLLFTIHVQTNGDLFYSNAAIVRDGVFTNNYSYLPDLINQLTSKGSIKTVLFSIGSGGADDWTNLDKLLQNKSGMDVVARNFAALKVAMPVDGFDFDNEDSNSVDVIVKMTKLLADDGRMIITFCPFNDPEYWTSALRGVYQMFNRELQPVRWWNLQCYAGGEGNQPQQWAAAVAAANAGVNGTVASQQYIVPGVEPTGGPGAVSDCFAQFRASDPNINGGFIWNLAGIDATTFPPRAYAAAILEGIGAKAARRRGSASPRLPIARP